MHYTITALSQNANTLETMRQSLLAVGALANAIVVSSGIPGVSEHQISVNTDDLEAAEMYQEVLTLAGGHEVSSNEESSVFSAVHVPSDS